MTYLPTAFYHLLNTTDHPLLVYRVKNPLRKSIRVRLTSFIEGYSQKAIDELEIDSMYERHVVQMPELLSKETKPITKLIHASLNILVENIDTGRVEADATEQIGLLPYDSVPLELRNPSTGEIVDLSRYLGAFVTPNVLLFRNFYRLQPNIIL